MKYQVTFRQRYDAQGNPSDTPTAFLNLTDGVIQDVQAVERINPPSLHVEGRMEEDDDFLAYGTEVWEFDVTPGRDQEFKDALVNSEVVLEFQPIEEELIAGGGGPAARS